MNRKRNRIVIMSLSMLFSVQAHSYVGSYSNVYTKKVEETVRRYKYIKGKISCENVKKTLVRLAEIKSTLSPTEAEHLMTQKAQKDLSSNLVVQVCERNKFDELSKDMNRFLRNFAKHSPIRCNYEKHQVNHTERVSISAGGLWYFYKQDINEAIRLFCPELNAQMKERKKTNPARIQEDSVDQ